MYHSTLLLLPKVSSSTGGLIVRERVERELESLFFGSTLLRALLLLLLLLASGGLGHHSHVPPCHLTRTCTTTLSCDRFLRFEKEHQVTDLLLKLYHLALARFRLARSRPDTHSQSTCVSRGWQGNRGPAHGRCSCEADPIY